jgi:CubicO group peptidase (beta-lactamase class C family)
MGGIALKNNVLEGFGRVAREKNLGVFAAHVYQRGERETALFCDGEREHLFSGSKTFTSMAVGIAAGEKRFSLSDKALDFFPQYKDTASQGSEKITVRDLLHMQAGHAESMFSTLEDTWERERDWAEVFFQRPIVNPAGQAFLYDNGCTYMLSRIVEAASGQTLRDYLMPRLFAPLDIYYPQWHACPGGHTLGAVGLYLTAEEFARLGILMLQNGVWEDKRLVPEDYIRAATQDTVETAGFDDAENRCGYGYQLWRCTVPGAYRADGKYGQYSIVLPEREAVVAVTAHNANCANDILRAVWAEILPALD